ncbi:calcium-binding protein [Pseudoprimorskyibacter insulae]|uniref:Bifunctional hemolysin/adenylate cyclase n=1 Tax=Pseudoprimorskyibacter insulae TaxID=1695997 RepID=A0A2R8AWB0_9RHOB|nr:calcium-binding protein [Pseudoprimorskyibacter insulae]SPF80313.1 Bifunctional hemolysin/adenylate cyclase [Pseudoprimorskyibacter insulae]
MAIAHSTVTDNSLLPFNTAGGVNLFEGQNYVYRDTQSQWVELADIFANGIQLGDETYTGFNVKPGYGLQFGNGQGYDTTRIAALYSNIRDYYYRSASDLTGVYVDKNTDRDSVVITWYEMQTSGFTDASVTMQVELMDRGDGDAEVIFRFNDVTGLNYYPHHQYGPSFFVIDGEGSARTPLGYVPGLEMSQYDTIVGNTGVAGVWQFTLEDGQLNTSEFATTAVIEDGTSGDDSYTGSLLGDAIRGADGNDTLDGGYGNDTLNGGAGDDSLTGGFGWNFLFGGDGNDTLDNRGSSGGELYAGAGDNLVRGGGGMETITAGNGNDSIYAGEGSNTINASSGENRIITGSGHDRITTGIDADAIQSGWGNDTINTFAGNDTVEAGGGNDTVHSGDGDDLVVGGDDQDYITAGLGDDFVNGGAGDDKILGAAGNDTLLTGTGSDTVYGGEGNDSLDGGTAAESSYRYYDYSIYRYVYSTPGKELNGDAGDDTIMGSHYNDTISGGTGNDYIDGRRGNDSIGAGDGDDTIIGSEWDGTDEDWIYAGDGADSVFGGGGHDTIYGGAGNDTLVGGFGRDLILGGDGDDIIFGGEGYDNVTGGDGADKFVASGAKTDVSVITDYNPDEGDVLVLDVANVSVGNLRLLGDRLTDLSGNPAEFRSLSLIDVGDDGTLEQTIFTFANATELDRLVLHMADGGIVQDVIDLDLF